MSGQKFQYDESGGTFFYFLLSFLALLLVPGTYYLWPRCPKQDPDQLAKECQCDGCKKKKVILHANKPWKETKAFFTKFLIIVGWIILLLLAYKVSQFDYEMANFDPYEILSIPPGSSQSEIKKAYRKLSLILHPDKETGNEKAFMKLTKAYQALTDDEARKNWEKYGNPDGPGAMSFGIALPSWIVEKENSVWVLGLYALVFMVALPTVVGMWWYKSIRYTGDQVLLTTTEMYYFFFVKTPSMSLKRVIMILAASFEFFKKRNAEIVERHSDSEEVPSLIKQLPNLGEKNKEVPLCHLYSIKARALLHAHLSRISLNPETLDKDRQYIVKKCPYLIQEMVACVHQVILLAYARRVPRVPTITTIENCMKLCPMVVQGFWEFKNPLLQLPHITEDNLKYFHAKKRQIKSLQQFAQLKGEERRLILRNLSDSQYEDVIKVLGNMPYIDFKVRSEVIDDENPTVYTAGAIVTVTVSLTRKDMKHLFGDDSVNEQTMIEDNKAGGEAVEEASEEQNQSTKATKPAWLKQKKGQKKSHKKGTNKKIPPAKNTQAQSQTVANNTQHSNTPNARKKDDKTEKESSKEKLSDVSDSEAESDRSDDEDSHDKKDASLDDDDTEWEKFQQRISKRERVLEGRSNLSHEVHCPLFPDVKQEYWWVYICDRKSQTLLTTPIHVTSLAQFEEIQLRFTAPRWPGLYTFTVCLRSDSYLGFDQAQDIKLDVKEAPEIPTEHPQWDISDEETAEDVDAADEHSEFTTDEDISDNE
ncbi:Translocation protein SEC63 like protein [Trachymyrmex septentrionalis]|uniref:Translocation protein SEC63 like protein n=1 Tax=Trachymyrmex septentrionalis TaxID=34720 RepID=A0A195EU84_9HYME|nr:PREDICTED: translocation protein SEC63 homolog isoform X1 [Trachymyrmex septentrionalis]XP_018353402.1 PREDICTED: translocation protein SEC63 homolog isoform X2 [Trachymyrmex septentrionalis]KYN31808.1 Translocation protein SEC63 like protein [Trachymyrmex septentrionalis]